MRERNAKEACSASPEAPCSERRFPERVRGGRAELGLPVPLGPVLYSLSLGFWRHTEEYTLVPELLRDSREVARPP